MNLRELHYILKVAELRSVTGAANALHISQPALSRYIHDVESELGTKIFDRSTNPISLTYAGECYTESAKRILLEHENLRREIRDITHHMTGRLRIGTSRDRASFMMPKLLPSFSAKYPGIRTEIFTDSGQNLREALRDGRIDILMLPDVQNEGGYNFESRRIYVEELVLAVKAGTIPDDVCANNRKSIKPEYLSGMKFFLLFKEHAIRTFCDKFFRDNNIKPNIAMEFSSNITCYRMAAAGMGATIIPALTAEMTVPGCEAEIFSLGNEAVTWDVKAFWRKGAYIGEPERELMRLAGEIFGRELHGNFLRHNQLIINSAL